jgi:hypothetical protein
MKLTMDNQRETNMKKRKEILDYFDKYGVYQDNTTGRQLGRDMEILTKYARCKDYYFTVEDAFAIGYMSAQSKLNELFNETKLKKAIEKYDRADMTNRFDTVGEVFMDLLDLKLDD